MAICNCALGGTAACKHCPNNSEAEIDNSIHTYTTDKIEITYPLVIPFYDKNTGETIYGTFEKPDEGEIARITFKNS